MMDFSPPQPECQIIDCKAAYNDGDTDNLLDLVRNLKIGKRVWRVLGGMDVLLPLWILAQ